MTRKSPSGPLLNEPSQWPGSNSLETGLRYMPIGDVSTPVSLEAEGQIYIATPSKLQSLEVQIITAGADAVNVLWNVRINGILVPGMIINLQADEVSGASVAPDDATELAIGDLVSLLVTSGTIAGTSPLVRTFVNISER